MEIEESEEFTKVVCLECNKKFGILTSHMKKHDMTLNEYMEKHNLSKDDCYSKKYIKFCSDKIKGSNNPGYQHGGKLSPFSKKFVNYTEEKLKEVTERAGINRNKPESKSTCIEYYLAKGHDLEESKKLLSERQTTFTLEKCIDRHGKIEGTRIYNDRQERWMKSLYDKTPEELDIIMKKKMSAPGSISKKEKEITEYLIDNGFNIETQFILSNGERRFLYDIGYEKKIIEYNGDYYHCNPKIYSEDYYNAKIKKYSHEVWGKDKIKIDYASEMGYEVLIIWEKDYKKDKESELQKCLNFLGGVKNEIL